MSEESVAGYTSSQDGLNFTNTQLPKGEVDNLPETGVAQNYLGNYMVIAGVCLLLVSYIKKIKRA